MNLAVRIGSKTDGRSFGCVKVKRRVKSSKSDNPLDAVVYTVAAIDGGGFAGNHRIVMKLDRARVIETIDLKRRGPRRTDEDEIQRE